MKSRSFSAVLACGLLAQACGNSDSPRPEPSNTGAQAPALKPTGTAGGKFATTPANTAAQAPQPTAPTLAPAPAGYPLTDIKTIADNCATPMALLATAPESVGDSYAWAISRQALLANQQFRVTGADPAAPGEVHLATYKYNNAYALIATCKDGGTCNNLAAMYKAIVRSSHPQVICGKMNGLSSSPVGSGFGWAGDPRQNLPSAGDAVAACARLDACQIATDRSTPGDPFLECQKAPAKFKTDCAGRYPCSEVLACMAR
jgi:hypothetical protein